MFVVIGMAMAAMMLVSANTNITSSRENPEMSSAWFLGLHGATMPEKCRKGRAGVPAVGGVPSHVDASGSGQERVTSTRLRL